MGCKQAIDSPGGTLGDRTWQVPESSAVQIQQGRIGAQHVLIAVLQVVLYSKQFYRFFSMMRSPAAGILPSTNPIEFLDSTSFSRILFNPSDRTVLSTYLHWLHQQLYSRSNTSQFAQFLDYKLRHFCLFTFSKTAISHCQNKAFNPI
jgi:hypothetical protein